MCLPCFSLLLPDYASSLLSEKSALTFMLSDPPNPYFYGPPGYSPSSSRVFSAWLSVTFSKITPALILSNFNVHVDDPFITLATQFPFLPMPLPSLILSCAPRPHVCFRDSIIRNPPRIWDGMKV